MRAVLSVRVASGPGRLQPIRAAHNVHLLWIPVNEET